MGDGEFVGGGSVEWEINNKDDNGVGGPKQHKGKDKNPPARSGGTFSVYVNGVKIVPDFPVDGNKVKVEWR
jgi:hypothetical protein